MLSRADVPELLLLVKLPDRVNEASTPVPTALPLESVLLARLSRLLSGWPAVSVALIVTDT